MQITPSIHAIKHTFKVPITPNISIDRFVYSYLIYGETITLIDTGVAGGEVQIFETIRSSGRNPSEIALIILTHSHPDHIGSARAIQRESCCSIAAHPAERAWIEDVDLQNRERPVPGFTTLVGGSVNIDHELNNGDSIEPDETREGELQVFSTPGHSAGSISLFMHNEGALFSGDAIPVPGDLPVYDNALLSVESVKKLKKIRGIRVLLSSWDEPRKDGVVLDSAGEGIPDPMELTIKSAAVLGLPPQAVNPLLTRTFAANLKVRDQKNLLSDF